MSTSSCHRRVLLLGKEDHVAGRFLKLSLAYFSGFGSASLTPSAALTMQVSASAGSGTTISVYESIELVATTPNGHAYLDGIFSWEPLAVQPREG
jgi:hypothetical protein